MSCKWRELFDEMLGTPKPSKPTDRCAATTRPAATDAAVVFSGIAELSSGMRLRRVVVSAPVVGWVLSALAHAGVVGVLWHLDEPHNQAQRDLHAAVQAGVSSIRIEASIASQSNQASLALSSPQTCEPPRRNKHRLPSGPDAPSGRRADESESDAHATEQATDLPSADEQATAQMAHWIADHAQRIFRETIEQLATFDASKTTERPEKSEPLDSVTQREPVTQREHVRPTLMHDAARTQNTSDPDAMESSQTRTQPAQQSPAQQSPASRASTQSHARDESHAQVGAQVDQLPKPLESNQAPVYPPVALQQGQSGRVVLRVHVSSEGTVSQLSVHQSSGVPSLDQAAVSAVSQWRFQAAQRGEQSVPFVIDVPLRFALPD